MTFYLIVQTSVLTMVLECFKMNIFNGCVMRNFLRSELFFDLEIRCDLCSRYNLRQLY